MKSRFKLPAESNGRLKQVNRNKLEIHFPREQGVLRVGRSKFKDWDDFMSYLSEMFPLVKHERGHRVTITRKGKYRRINEKGKEIFAFGDPLLDLITDDHGWVTIGKERHNLADAELAEPRSRGGGIHAIDLSPRPGEFDRMVSNAALGRDDLSIVEASAEHAVLASRNPSEVWFYNPSGTAKMRFRAFKRNYWVGWKIGADVETWNLHFTRAAIQSYYGFWEYDRACGVAKQDSDSDTNDDYMSEYEWGVSSPMPNGVSSYCTATWGGASYGRYVSKGDCDYWLIF